MKTKRKEQKNQSGITLVALVVTIAVLIILAVISVQAVFSDSGIIKQAEKAAAAQANAEASDSEVIGEFEQHLANAIAKDETGGSTKTLVAMYDAGLSCTEENCTNPEHLHIGDYVNYKNPTSGEVTISGTDSGTADWQTNESVTLTADTLNQTFKVANNQVRWRVLGKDETTGGLKLIAAVPIKKESTINDPYFYMYGAKAYVNVSPEEGERNLLNEICSMYENVTDYKTGTVVEARSVNMDDIDQVTGITTDALKQEKNYYTAIGGTQYKTPYPTEGVTFTNHYTPTDWLKDPKVRSNVSGTTDAYAYAVNAPAEVVEQGLPIVEISAESAKYKLLFENIEWTNEAGQGRPYWLASRGVYANFDYALFGPGAVRSQRRHDRWGLGQRNVPFKRR